MLRTVSKDLTVPAYKIILQDAEVKLGKPLSLNIDFGSGSKNDTAARRAFAQTVTCFASMVNGNGGQQVCFDVHERFGHLQAESVQSRLLLANLFAGTGCDVPDPRLGATWHHICLSLMDFHTASTEQAYNFSSFSNMLHARAMTMDSES